jgi:hypothetical protein
MDDNQRRRYESLYELIAAGADKYEASAEAQRRVWEGQSAPRAQPLLLHAGLPGPYAEYPRYNLGEIHYDKDKMLLNGMLDMAGAALGGMHAVPSIRANMGCGILPCMFPGLKQRVFYDDRMPWIVEHLTKDTIASLDEKDIGLTDEFKLALEHMAYIAERIGGTGAYLFPLDVQGPFDIAHLVYGDSIFYDMYDDPPFIRHLMDLSCVAIERGFDECVKLMPRSDEYVAHYNSVVLPRTLGGVKLSEDTSTLIGGDFLDEYAIPSTKRVLKHAGGGYIHYCGKHEGLFGRLACIPDVRGFNFGNPDFHDMESMLYDMANNGKIYYGGSYMLNGESRLEYFIRMLRAATTEDGMCKLLLQVSAPYGELDAVREDWDRATASI